MTTIYFVRHGHVRNPLKLFYGRSMGFPLSAEGRKQARYAAEYLRDKSIDEIYSSPLLRARETAEIILSSQSDKLLRISDLLLEVHCPYDGQPVDVVSKRNWDVYSDVGIGFEQPEDVLLRARKFITGILLGHNGQNIVAVSHGDLISFLILWANGKACTPANKQELYGDYLKPGSIFIFSFDGLGSNEIPRVKYVDMNNSDESLEKELGL
jgi:broad specificity phosphatase PhoE